MGKPISPERSEAADWGGQVSSVGTRSKAVGVALSQVNLVASVPGEVQARPGLRPVVFEAEAEG